MAKATPATVYEEHGRWQREHLSWLQELERWQEDHRTAIEQLTALEPAIRQALTETKKGKQPPPCVTS